MVTRSERVEQAIASAKKDACVELRRVLSAPYGPDGTKVGIPQDEQVWAVAIVAARPEWALGVLTELGFTEGVSAPLAARLGARGRTYEREMQRLADIETDSALAWEGAVESAEREGDAKKVTRVRADAVDCAYLYGRAFAALARGDVVRARVWLAEARVFEAAHGDDQHARKALKLLERDKRDQAAGESRDRVLLRRAATLRRRKVEALRMLLEDDNFRTEVGEVFAAAFYPATPEERLKRLRRILAIEERGLAKLEDILQRAKGRGVADGS